MAPALLQAPPIHLGTITACSCPAHAAGNTGVPLIVSISADGIACAWQDAGASCLLRQHLSVFPARGWVLMPDGHHICFSCCLPPHAQPRPRPPSSLDVPSSSGPDGRGSVTPQSRGGAACTAGIAGAVAPAQRLLAVLEPLSMALKGLLRPVSIKRLPVLSPGKLDSLPKGRFDTLCCRGAFRHVGLPRAWRCCSLCSMPR